MNPKNVTPFSHYILTMNKNVPCKFVSRLFVKRILLVSLHAAKFPHKKSTMSS